MRKIAVGVALYVAVLGALAVWRWHIWTYGTDTGTFSQVVADAFGGFRDGPEQGTHFRFHWAPLLAVLYPLVALTRSALSLQLAQVVLISLCAPALYALARPYVSEASAVRIGVIPLLYPPLAAVAFTEFHEIAFYPALALGLVWAADRTRWSVFAALAVCSALIREEACLIFAFVGCVFAALGWARRRSEDGGGLLLYEPREPRRLALAGLALVGLNLAALGMYYGLVIPRVGPWQPSRFYEYSFAHGPLQLVAALAMHPAYALELFTFGRFTYVLEAFVPLAFLPLRSRWTLLALPGLAIVLLASDPITWRMGSHYAAIWIPWLLLGTAAALAGFERRRSPARARSAALASIGSCVLFLVAFDPLHPAHYLRPVYPTADAARALAALPAGAGAVATHDEWFAHIALERPQATVFYCPYVRYAVYADDYPNGYFQNDILPQIERELANGTAKLVARFGKVAVYRRTPPPGAHVGNCITPGDVRYRAPHA